MVVSHTMHEFSVDVENTLVIGNRCPTGQLTLIPIHASGKYPDGICCSDYFISSYTSTLTTLLKSQSSSQQLLPPCVAKVVLAAVPHATYSHAPYIGGTTQEVDAVYAQLHSMQPPLLHPSRVVTLHSAKSETLLAELQDVSILHLACHGSQVQGDPLKSGFLMADRLLTVEDLMKHSVHNAFLAILSACQTARGDVSQADQAVHLAATMQFLGFKSVVATMWYACALILLSLANYLCRSMRDSVGTDIGKTLYQHMYKDPSKPLDPDVVALALDEAVRRLRTTAHGKERLPSIWAPFIHIGL